MRSPHSASKVADLIDENRALLDATATAHVSVQTEPATATVGTTMDSFVTVREAAMAELAELQLEHWEEPPPVFAW